LKNDSFQNAERMFRWSSRFGQQLDRARSAPRDPRAPASVGGPESLAARGFVGPRRMLHVLKAQLRNQRPLLTDGERRRLAVLGARLGRRPLAEVATIVTPDTIR
jgi:hypothetical protein